MNETLAKLAQFFGIKKAAPTADTFVPFHVHAEKEIEASIKASEALQAKLEDGISNMDGVIRFSNEQIDYYSQRANQAHNMRNEYQTHLLAAQQTLATVKALGGKN